jgi:hypothetical protein
MDAPVRRRVVGQPELAEHVGDVRLDRSLGHDEACRDCPVRQPLRNEFEPNATCTEAEPALWDQDPRWLDSRDPRP